MQATSLIQTSATQPVSSSLHLRDIAAKDDPAQLLSYIGPQPEALNEIDPSDKSTLLISLIRANAKKCAKSLLEAHPTKSHAAVDEKKRDALHYASMKGFAKVVQLLLKYGLNPFKVDAEGISAYHLAIQGEHLDCLQMLSATISQFTQQAKELFQPYTKTPLHLAAGCRTPVFLQVVIRDAQALQIADLAIPNEKNETPLHIAVDKNTSFEKAETLLQSKVKASVVDIYGRSPLSIACQHNNKRQILRLAEYGADLNLGYPLPLFQLFLHDEQDLFSLFIAKFANTYLPVDAQPNGPSIAAAIQATSDQNFIRLLPKLQPSPSPSKAMNSLFAVCENGTLEECESLLKSNCDVMMRDGQKRTILHAALLNPNRCLFYFLASCFRFLINEPNDKGQTPLHIAIGLGDVVAVQLLVKLRAKIDLVTQEKNSVLHLLSDITKGTQAHVRAIADLLLSQHAPLEALNSTGQTPLEYAYSKGNGLVLDLLLSYGAKPEKSAYSKDQKPLLIQTTESLNYSATEKLVIAGAKRNIVYEASGRIQTPLFSVLRARPLSLSHVHLVALLLSNQWPKPSDPNRGSENEAPLTTIARRLVKQLKKEPNQTFDKMAAFQIFEHLIKNGANPDTVVLHISKKKKRTISINCLTLFLQAEQPLLVEKLLKANANPNLQVGDNPLPLTYACKKDLSWLVSELLKHGAKIPPELLQDTKISATVQGLLQSFLPAPGAPKSPPPRRLSRTSSIAKLRDFVADTVTSTVRPKKEKKSKKKQQAESSAPSQVDALSRKLDNLNLAVKSSFP